MAYHIVSRPADQIFIGAGALPSLPYLAFMLSAGLLSSCSSGREGAFHTSIGLVMQRIEPAKFLMGSPQWEDGRGDDEAQHEVAISQPFWIGATEVTQKQWFAVMNTQPWVNKEMATSGDSIPVTHINWQDAATFCEKLTERERFAGRLPAGLRFTLPTEAEWELACRGSATNTSAYCFGDAVQDLRRHAVVAKSIALAALRRNSNVEPVGSYKANEFGLYDMHGNVGEWCADAADLVSDRVVTIVDEDGVVDPLNISGEMRVCRGGTWAYEPAKCRSASRDACDPARAYIDIGFRPVLVARAAPSGESYGAFLPQESSMVAVGNRIEAGLGVKMIKIGPANFIMGSPVSEANRNVDESRHRVEISQGYWIAETEITRQQWRSVMGTTPWAPELEAAIPGDSPATHVSWTEAIQFCETMTVRERQAGRLPTGMAFDLPTEAEWELACRGSEANTTAYCFGDDPKMLGQYAVVQPSGSEGDATAESIRSKQPNAFGIYDMHGNVYEWCRDHAEYENGLVATSTYHDGIVDPLCAGGRLRVIRGGASCADADMCRSANRLAIEPSAKSRHIGFRLALVAARGSCIKTSIGLAMIRVSPSQFVMGSPVTEQGRNDDEFQHRVTISRSYWIGETEVTQSQWSAVMGTAPWASHTFGGHQVAPQISHEAIQLTRLLGYGDGSSHGDKPATHISWKDAVDFCARLTNLEKEKGRLPLGMSFTLPTEAEWELACRASATDTSPYHFGDNLQLLNSYAICARPAPYLLPVSLAEFARSTKANALGLHEMHGNVAEWCADSAGVTNGRVVTDTYRDGIVDPFSINGALRVRRGGSWFEGAAYCRSAARAADEPASARSDLGFRPVLVPRAPVR
jgi:formylglycine-generating enzyme required for sulfatase activity